MNEYLPVEYDVRGRPAVVVGADALVISKVERLLRAGARVTVYACEHEVEASVDELARAGELRLERGGPDCRTLEDACVVFVSPAVEGEVDGEWERARAKNRLWCTLDRPERSTFVNPAVATRAGIGLRLVSGGKSPALLRRLREDLERLLSDPRLERFVDELGSRRAALPREGRGARMRAAVRGFAITGRLVFPGWFEAGGEPPPS
jgi:siroheme synthase-like protein